MPLDQFLYFSVCVGAAAFSGSAIFVPWMRPVWKGTSVHCGPVSCCGATLLFAWIAVLILCSEKLPIGRHDWLMLPFGLSVALLGLGHYADVNGKPQDRLTRFAVGIVVIVVLIFVPTVFYSLRG